MKPYRFGAPRPAAQPAERSLGGLRSHHAAATSQRRFRVGLSVVLIAVPVCAGLFTSQRGISMASVIMAAVLLAMGALTAWRLLPPRPVAVDLHDEGLALLPSAGRVEIHFDHVDEVWFSVDVAEASIGGRLATLRSIRLVTSDKRSVQISASLARFDALLDQIDRTCTYPLIAQAEQAIEAGEALTFGAVVVDRDKISVKGTEHPWSAIRLTRIQVDRACLFVSQTVVPWRTISWDDVPHPRLFFRLLQRLAPNQEVEPGAKLGF